MVKKKSEKMKKIKNKINRKHTSEVLEFNN